MSTRALIVLAGLGAALWAPGPSQAGTPSSSETRTPISSAAQLYTCCTPPEAQERMFAEAEASGAEFVRVDVELNGIFEAEGSRERPDWRALDRMIEAAERFDVELLGILRGSPTWLSDCPERGPDAPLCAPRDPTEFGRLAGEVAAHAAGSIDHWEILNEPDARWAFKGSAEQYARMLEASYDAIKSRAPEALVVFGGVERPREHEWIRRVLATPGTDVARSFDIAAVHLRVRLRNELPDLVDWLVGWRELLAGAGFRGPIWVTEHGYPADPQFQWDPAYRGGDAAQAAYLRESLPLLAEAGADQIFVTLRDNLFGEFLSEGLVHLNESDPGGPAQRRAAFEAVRDLAGSWGVVIETRARRRHHQGRALALARLSARSRQAGRELAAALQDGAVKGHLLVADRLTVELAG